MAKTEFKQKSLMKACYGTKEWSENSGICCNCSLQKECGKIEKKVKTRSSKSSEFSLSS
ncbi:MAG: hypothetical protein WCX73_02185 [Candidatus Pacearchaeota archaeon]|jgi:hypothetical protein